ncbi:SNF family Na+-dependent transporter [Halobacteroides halobius DSM 5150]|uniref:SNF family Na+-dependent transporter n=1 Tax=Halobacteroides halobius (strain ATCC 35273 / DSM 5150 / MD-1) TaxID=748449 RepID=L0K7J9_HALHC|nr:sodium-dependent transporter [Halobacteroides halobius]AGB40309.1 SNF family Na+-dependent transporter [Halobacteroides halobius DSM 5150]
MAKEEQWQSRAGFILAVIGSAVGLGNIWRFSYVAYDNGGGAFLIPYFIALVMIGIPILILEFSFGRKMRGSAALSFRKLAKKWEWLGWWPTLATLVLVIYYMAIIGWSLNYVFYSFGQVWGKNPEAFFYNQHLNLTSSVGQLGGINWTVFAAVFVIWIINYAIIYNGIENGIEKASKIFMPLLAILMLVITIRGITLPGAIEGINKYLQPDFSQLMNGEVWLAAFSQIFFTLSIGWGVMITYSSYQPEDSDIVNNAFIASLANCGFSFIVGLGVFSILGYMATQTGQPIEGLVAESIGLAFIAFPKAINMLPAFQTAFGSLFFISLVIAGLSSSISMIEATVANIQDKFAISRKKAASIVCLTSCLGSVLFTTGAGLYLLDIIDHFLMQFGAGLAAIFFCLVLGWGYGAQRLRKFMNQVSDFEIGVWWEIMIKLITPGILIIMFGKGVIANLTKGYGDYSTTALILGWSISIVVILFGIYLSSLTWQEKSDN